MSKNTPSNLAVTGVLAILLSACGGGSSSTNSTTTTDSGSSTSTSTAGVLCDYASSLFNSSPSVNATATVRWSCSSTQRSVVANGLPDHAVGTFPNSDNPNTIAAQSITLSASLTPTQTTVNTTFGPGAGKPGIALNGIVFDPGTAGTCDDSGTRCQGGGGPGGGTWTMEALGQSSFRFGTDSNNAHVQPGGVYHYHGVPEGLVTKLNKGTAMSLIGWAADGFPIYARYGYTTATDASSAIKVMASSFRLKTLPDANRPATSMYPMGAFTQDYEYVAGLGDLDECNGRTGVTPEFPSGIYHYYATDTFPHLQRCVKGSL
jgi:hypothetical protein